MNIYYLKKQISPRRESTQVAIGFGRFSTALTPFRDLRYYKQLPVNTSAIPENPERSVSQHALVSQPRDTQFSTIKVHQLDDSHIQIVAS